MQTMIIYQNSSMVCTDPLCRSDGALLKSTCYPGSYDPGYVLSSLRDYSFGTSFGALCDLYVEFSFIRDRVAIATEDRSQGRETLEMYSCANELHRSDRKTARDLTLPQIK